MAIHVVITNDETRNVVRISTESLVLIHHEDKQLDPASFSSPFALTLRCTPHHAVAYCALLMRMVHDLLGPEQVLEALRMHQQMKRAEVTGSISFDPPDEGGSPRPPPRLV